MQLVHGGDWAGYRAEYGENPLDFSANVSPLGVPQGVQAALAAAAGEADRYPDPLCRSLRAAIGQAENVPAEWVLCGCGAADLIWRIAWALHPRHALLPAPAFAEYAAALQSADCRLHRVFLQPETDFAVGEDFLWAITPDTGLVFLCEPNNPTGRTTAPALLRRILDRCRTVGAVLVVDECFNDFLGNPAAHTLVPLLGEYRNLIVLKAFTKMYAMAGVRLGYLLCADDGMRSRIEASGPPWAVSSLAQAAGLAALRDADYPRRVRALIGTERPRMAAALRALGLRVVDGEANYLLFQSAMPLLAPLRARGILLRGCGNYPGLDDTWYRTAVRTAPENDRLLAAMGEMLA